MAGVVVDNNTTTRNVHPEDCDALAQSTFDCIRTESVWAGV